MDWKQELLALFDDPLLADVRPLPPKITQDDRLTQSFLEIIEWVETNNREPQENSDSFKEKILYRRLQNLRIDKDKNVYLKEFDHLNLLK